MDDRLCLMRSLYDRGLSGEDCELCCSSRTSHAVPVHQQIGHNAITGRAEPIGA